MFNYEVIDVIELKKKLENRETFRLIDVREPSEYRVAKIEGSELMPLGQIMTWMQKLEDKDEEIVLMCHHGMRSDRACQFLAAQGFTKIRNLEGGIDAWSARIDGNVMRY
ncbi:MAG: rhodanese [Acidobacteria bacterium]|nr:rhodanese [Acidobacteriota bacterium]